MLDIKDIEKLATLARIELTAEEKEKYPKDIDSILNYIIQIKEVSGEIGERKAGEQRNIMREDIVKNETGEKTPEIISNFPDKDGDYLKVKKII